MKALPDIILIFIIKMSKKISDKLSDRFGSVFTRQKPREEQRPQKSYFNETYFDVKLAYHPHKLSLMKVDAFIAVGPDAGMPMMVNCRWFVKKGNQVSEIQGVRSSCYQPCIEDVGCSILVQIEPLIEGKIYSGATIAKETQPLELGATLETQFTDLKNKLYHFGEPVSFQIKIEGAFGSIYSQLDIQFPLEGKITICKQDYMDFDISLQSSALNTEFWITKQFPQIDFIRKSYNGIVISFSEETSIRLAFKQNTEREILGLLIQTLTANSSLDWPLKGQPETVQKIEQEIRQLEEQKIEGPNAENPNTSSQKIEQKSEQNQQTAVQTQQEQETSNPIKSEQRMNEQPIRQKQDQKSLEKIIQVPNREAQIKLEKKIGALNSEVNKLKSQYKQLLKNYQLEKQIKIKLQNENKNFQQRLQELQNIKAEKEKIAEKNLKFGEDNRFYKNQIALMKKSMKERNEELLKLREEKNSLIDKLKKQEIDVEKIKKQEIITGNQIQSKLSQITLINKQLNDQNQNLKIDIEKLQNELKVAHQKINSLCQEKTVMISPVKSQSNIPLHDNSNQMASKIKTIKQLEFKLSNLEMLLKFKSGEKGSEAMGLQKIINSLTEAITDKDEQLAELRKINKELLKKINGK